jgi:hypothetical protein
MKAYDTGKKKGREILIKIYDPPMCCSSGVCGPNVNSVLVEFSGALKSLASMGLELNAGTFPSNRRHLQKIRR